MRHERISQSHVAAAAWPTMIEGLVLAEPAREAEEAFAPVAEPAVPTPAALDVAAGVGGLIVAAYAGLILVFFAFFAGSPLAAMAVTIAALFVAIFFAVPRIFFAIEPAASRRPTLTAFMHEGIDTLTGHCSGRDALVQMLLVPVLLTLGLLAMGIAGAIYL